jgi:predicted metal-dependent enzyme (double-stranded beta helix superfamily)
VFASEITDDFLAALDGTHGANPRDVFGDASVDLVRWIDTRRHRALALAQFDPHSYRRELIERGKGFELYLLSWLPGQATPIHDHGEAITACEVLRGELLEERFVRHGAFVRKVGDELSGPGVVDVHGADIIHRVTAIEPTVSLLVYLPGASDYRTFSELEAAA